MTKFIFRFHLRIMVKCLSVLLLINIGTTALSPPHNNVRPVFVD